MSSPYSLAPTAPEKSWLERHARWKIPIGCLIVVVLLGGFVAAVFTVVSTSFRRSYVFQEAIARAERNPQVADRIGTPLRPGWVPQGRIEVSGSSGSAQMEIPVTGPHGKATISLEARKVAGTWRFSTLQVQLEGQSDSVNLLAGDEGAGH
jgi:hypothetical protein